MKRGSVPFGIGLLFFAGELMHPTFAQEVGSNGQLHDSFYQKDVYDIVLYPTAEYETSPKPHESDPQLSRMVEMLLEGAYENNREPRFRIHPLESYLSGELAEELEYVIGWDYLLRPVDVSASAFSYAGDIIYLRMEQFDCASQETITFVRKGTDLTLDTLVEEVVSYSAMLPFAFENGYRTED